jgi:hypothetical protein
MGPLFFFVLVDGWSLVAGSLVQSYATRRLVLTVRARDPIGYFRRFGDAL